MGAAKIGGRNPASTASRGFRKGTRAAGYAFVSTRKTNLLAAFAVKSP